MKEKLNRLLFTSKTRMRVFSKLSRYLSNGVPVTFALAELYKFTSDEGRKKIIRMHLPCKDG